jgi:hypothetical protein
MLRKPSIWLFPDQNSGQNSNIKRGNQSFETVKQFKYLGTIPTNQNSIHEEIKSRLKSQNACYHMVQNFLSSSLLSKKKQQSEAACT